MVSTRPSTIFIGDVHGKQATPLPLFAYLAQIEGLFAGELFGFQLIAPEP